MMFYSYQHCVSVVSGWRNHHKMQHLLSSKIETKKQHLLEKFDKLSKENSSSVRDLVTLAAQIIHPQPEDPSPRGYWSNPEDQVEHNGYNKNSYSAYL